MHTPVKRFFFLCALFAVASFSPVWAAESGKDGANALKEGIQSIVSDIVSAGKDVAAGVTEGVDSGRKGRENLDKAQIVTSREDLEKLLSVTVVKSEEMGDKSFQLTLAVKNTHAFSVRMTNLSEMANVVLLDKEGFSYPLPQAQTQGRDVTAIGNSLTRVRYTFTGVEGEPATLRLYGADIAVPKPVRKSAS